MRTSTKRDTALKGLDAPSACRECGVILEEPTRQYCDDCLPEYREVQAVSFSETRRARLQAMRATGIDPPQTEGAAEKRRLIMQQRRREEAAWDAAHPDHVMDESFFVAGLLPQLQGLSITQISEMTGLSRQY